MHPSFISIHLNNFKYKLTFDVRIDVLKLLGVLKIHHLAFMQRLYKQVIYNDLQRKDIKFVLALLALK